MAIDSSKLEIRSGQLLSEAIRIINHNQGYMGLVVDDHHRLLGIVTDGDIRRALVKGVDGNAVVDSIMRKDPLVINEPLKSEDIVDLIHHSDRHPEYIPSVNSDNQPQKLYHVSELFSVHPGMKEVDVRTRPKKVLLIGGGGYIGSLLTDLLIQDHYQVTILDAFLYGDYSIDHLRNSPSLRVINGDTRQIDILVPAIKDADAVVHLAELVGDQLCAKDPAATFEINYLATDTITRICSNMQVNRYIYLSSCSVYGASANADTILDEESPVAPVSLYARMKIDAERAILGTGNENFSPCIFRLGTVFGFSHRPRFDLVVNVLSAKAVVNREISIFGGDQWRPHVHVSDVARAIKLALKAPIHAIKNQVFNIVGENMTIKDLGNLVAKLLPETKVRLDNKVVDKRNYIVTGQRAREVLGFEPAVTLRDGILELASAIRSGEVADFSDPRYYNYNP